jgi:hypothetical protein
MEIHGRAGLHRGEDEGRVTDGEEKEFGSVSALRRQHEGLHIYHSLRRSSRWIMG